LASQWKGTYTEFIPLRVEQCAEDCSDPVGNIFLAESHFELPKQRPVLVKCLCRNG